MAGVSLLFLDILSVILSLVLAQDDFGGGEDAGSDALDMDSMLQSPGNGAKSDSIYTKNIQSKIISSQDA